MPETKPRTKKAKRAAMKQTMDEWKSGKLHSGSKTGPKVTSQKQAVAIGLKQSGQSRSKKSPKLPSTGGSERKRSSPASTAQRQSGRRSSTKKTKRSAKQRLANAKF